MTPNENSSLQEELTSIVRDGEFESIYANNVSIEGTTWDLQAVFGSLEKDATGHPIVNQHTMISMPWAVAKIACFHLALNIIVFEHNNGAIRLPVNVLPLVAGLTEGARHDPRIMAVFEALIGLGNPEAVTAQHAILAAQAAQSNVAESPENPDERMEIG
jgi:hypothetical protein